MKVTIKDLEYNIPQYINIENYVKLYSIQDLFDDEYYEIKLINIITGANTEDIMNLNHSKIKTISNFILSILPTTNFNFQDTFELNGIEYGFIPEYKNMSFGEFVDLDTLLSKKPNEVMDNLHIIAAIMFRPIISKKSKHKYKIEDYNQDTLIDRADLFKKELDIKYVLGGKFFFSKSVKTSSTYTPPFLTRMKMKVKNLMRVIKIYLKLRKEIRLKKHSDGSPLSIESVQTILRNTK